MMMLAHNNTLIEFRSVASSMSSGVSIRFVCWKMAQKSDEQKDFLHCGSSLRLNGIDLIL